MCWKSAMTRCKSGAEQLVAPAMPARWGPRMSKIADVRAKRCTTLRWHRISDIQEMHVKVGGTSKTSSLHSCCTMINDNVML
jgi:hypothetical protein